MEPCKQESNIGRLNATTEQIGQTLERLSSVLEQIARQGAVIEQLSNGQNILFERVRDMELHAESEKVKIGFIMAGISAITSGMVAYITKQIGGQ